MSFNAKLSALFLLVGLLATNSVPAEVYRWYDENGRAHYSDKNSTTANNRLPIRTYSNTSNAGTRNNTDKKLVMYATSWCGYCKKARKYFRNHRIAYTEYDIEKNIQAKAEYQQLGAPGVPLLLMGQKSMVGFSEHNFENFYR